MARIVLFIAKWMLVAALSVAMCEVSLVVWDFWPAYQLSGKGVGGGKGLQYFTLDTELLFRMLPNQLHDINRDGFRDTPPRNTGEALSVVAGDSFPMGLAVEANETFPNVLERLRANTEVYNLGVQGYGPDQAFVAFRRYGMPLKPKHLIVSIYPSNDFADLLHNRLIDTTPEGDTLIRVHPNPIESVLPTLRLHMFIHLLLHKRFLPQDREEKLNEILFEDTPSQELERAEELEKASKLMRLTLREFAQMARDNHIQLLAVVIPSFDSIEGKDRDRSRSPLDTLAVSLCGQEGIEVVDLDPVFRAWKGDPLYIAADRHLSVTGHRLVAEHLLERLR